MSNEFDLSSPCLILFFPTSAFHTSPSFLSLYLITPKDIFKFPLYLITPKDIFKFPVLESYERAYTNMVRVQQLSELEEFYLLSLITPRFLWEILLLKVVEPFILGNFLLVRQSGRISQARSTLAAEVLTKQLRVALTKLTIEALNLTIKVFDRSFCQALMIRSTFLQSFNGTGCGGLNSRSTRAHFALDSSPRVPMVILDFEGRPSDEALESRPIGEALRVDPLVSFGPNGTMSPKEFSRDFGHESSGFCS
ncbi:hypothetical protein G4B88_004615 [Cannabis sativa]|uniref:Uncharacterized protein n=1 Tax=Cannabis sativa TaxID=3483 RepID=A0A7J6G591_CANSA|nr:hypothetical protein G4B88_004615 [Cannabis sativa]